MKTIREVMTPEVVWVSPNAPVKTAVILMKGHNIGALPVLGRDENIEGIVTYLSLLGEPQDARVMEVMDTNYVVVDPDINIHDAADIMQRDQAGYLLVVDQNKLVGIVSPNDIIPELGKNFDPLTEMPWSDSFREWAMNALKSGQEISVIFIDLDQFGKFNKKHGHVVGDTVLKEVAKVIKQLVDPELDLACRYGGDEFAIASLRGADESLNLAKAIQDRISRIRIEGVSDGVSGSFGISGGRRTKEREDTHFAATVDDLVTRASKECTARKQHRIETDERPVAETKQADAVQTEQGQKEPLSKPSSEYKPTESRGARLKIQTINYTTTGQEARVGVVLQKEGREFKREVSGYVVDGKNILRMIAEATAGAVCKSLAPGHGIVVDDVFVYGISGDDQAVSVVANFIGPKWNVKHVGSSIVRRGDLYRAAAAALLSAVNRLIEITPQSELDDFQDDVQGESNSSKSA